MAGKIMKTAAEREAEAKKAKYSRDAKRMVPAAMAKPASGPRHSVRDSKANAFTATVRGTGSASATGKPSGGSPRSSAPKTSPKPSARPSASSSGPKPRPTTSPDNAPKRETNNARATPKPAPKRQFGKAGNDR